MTPRASAGALGAIVAARRRAVEVRRRERPRSLIERAIGRRAQGAAFRAAIEGPGIRVIAECKRRSPSKGILREIYDPVELAVAYVAGGACAISVLTEPAFFDGALDHLRAVRETVDVPLLRKDFLVDEYQLTESVEAGADAVLLIVAALDDGELAALVAAAKAMGLAALVEVHEAAELDRALACGAEIVGLNSRNLSTLRVDGGAAAALIASVPVSCTAVAESGLRTARDLATLSAAGCRAFLVGEHLVMQADAGAALRAMISEATRLWAGR